MWTKHLKNEERKNFEGLLRNSVLVLSRLRQIIQEKEDTIAKDEACEATYTHAGYPYLQAHFNGRRAALKELRELLDFIN